MIQGYAIPNATILGNNGAYKSEFYKALEGAKAAGATVEEAPCLLARGVEAYNDGLPSTPSLLIVPQFYKAGNLYQDVPPFVAEDSTMRFTVSRNTTATRVNSSGLIESVASGVPRIDWLGQSCPALLVEPSAQNLALQSRDLSQAVWVKTNVTATKNAVGADGSVSGATTLTATAASGTVLQAIVNISQSRVFSAYVRRVSGTGAIQMTTNGGTNWTTVSISSIYTQVACAAQTVLNGSVGFRMAVSGDVIEVDYTQGEVGPIATSAIPTTTAAVSRAADVITASGALVSGLIGQTEGTIYAEVDFRNLQAGRFLSINAGTTANRILLVRSATNVVTFTVTVSSISQYSVNSSALASGVHKFAAAYKQNDFAFYVDGSLVGTSNSGNVPACTQIDLGNETGLFNYQDRIRAAALYTTRLSNDQLAELTRL